MGGMLVNVFVRSNDQAAVVQAAKEALGTRYDMDPMDDLKQEIQQVLPANMEVVLGGIFSEMLRGAGANPDTALFLVSPSVNGWVGVHDSMMQNQDEFLCADAARELSGLLNTTAITFLVHDGDFLCYWLAKDGTLLDEYNSMPGYFEGPGEFEPSGGDAELLAEACGVPNKAAQLAALLSEPDGDAFGQLEALGDALGIDDASVDYNQLTYTPPKRIGFTVPDETPKIAHRDEYATITMKDMNR